MHPPPRSQKQMPSGGCWLARARSRRPKRRSLICTGPTTRHPAAAAGGPRELLHFSVTPRAVGYQAKGRTSWQNEVQAGGACEVGCMCASRRLLDFFTSHDVAAMGPGWRRVSGMRTNASMVRQKQAADLFQALRDRTGLCRGGQWPPCGRGAPCTPWPAAHP